MELSLTLDELYAIIDAARDAEFRKMKFAAALKGVNLDDNSEQEEKFQEMQYAAQAKAEGRTADQVKFEEYGIKVISELD